MVTLVNGAGNQIQVDKAGRPKSQYYFSPQGTAAQNWALVTAINALTFNPASATPKYGNLQFTATVPPENVPVPGARPFIGLEGQPFQPFHARFIPTNTNTLVLHNDCKTVVTSYPGKP